MKYLTIGTIITACALLSGCATVFNGTAPTGDGNSIYVAGSYSGFFVPQSGRVWKCPAKSKGQCKDVKVSFE